MLVSPKVDGELWFISVCDGSVRLVAPNGREITEAIPLLNELKKTVGAKIQNALIAGELFAVGEGSRPRVGDVASALSVESDGKRLGFSAFDLLSVNGDAAQIDYGQRYATLEGFFDGGKRAKVIKTFDVPKTEVAALYEDLVTSHKAEGLIARVSDGRIFKIKPTFHIDCVVIGFTQRLEQPDQARSLLLALIRSDGTHQVVGSCGNLGSDEQRRWFHEQLSASIVKSGFRKASGSGAMYQLTQPEIVVEIVASDVQSEDGSGAAIRQWALRLDPDDGWSAVAPVDGASLLHPNVARIRSDKEANEVDVRVAQLNERCHTRGLNEVVRQAELPKSEVIRREVFTKMSKGQTTLRKLLVWKTNKDETDQRFPAYVVHFTDYSPSRAAPLKREVRTAPNESIAAEIADAILADKIKGGWTQL